MIGTVAPGLMWHDTQKRLDAALGRGGAQIGQRINPKRPSAAAHR